MSSSAVNSSSSSIKQRQLKHLNSQFQTLQTNLTNLETLLKVTKLQADSIRKLGLIHGSLFMSANQVFYNEDTISNRAATTTQDQEYMMDDYEGSHPHSSSFIIPDGE